MSLCALARIREICGSTAGSITSLSWTRSFGWSQRQLMEWVKKAMAEVEKK
jgi:hypothetical protein